MPERVPALRQQITLPLEALSERSELLAVDRRRLEALSSDERDPADHSR